MRHTSVCVIFLLLSVTLNGQEQLNKKIIRRNAQPGVEIWV